MSKCDHGSSLASEARSVLSDDSASPLGAEPGVRGHYLDADRLQLQLLVVSMCVLDLTFMPLDRMFDFSSFIVWALVGLRSITALVSVVAFISISRTNSPKTMENVAFGWALWLGLAAIVMNGVRPTEFWANAAFDVALLLVFHLVLPLRFRRQAVLGVVLTVVGWFWFQLLRGDVPFQPRVAVTVGYAGTNLIGIAFAHRFHLHRKEEYGRLERERGLRRQLERALAEVATLRGMLPICSGCKSIRNDEGFWEQVEAYVGKRTEAQFSHGMCPSCIPKYFPELAVSDETGGATEPPSPTLTAVGAGHG